LVTFEELVKDWLTSLVATDGILLTISLMILTILYTATIMARWQTILIGAIVFVASILLIVSAFYAMDAHGTLILEVKTTNAKEKEHLSEKTRTRARIAELSFKASLIFLLIAIVLVVVLPNLSICINPKL